MKELPFPSPVVVVGFSTLGHLAIATDDGSVRVYQKPYVKVWKAVRNLGSEISSVAFEQDPSSTSLHLWIAWGQNVCTEIRPGFELKLTSSVSDILL